MKILANRVGLLEALGAVSGVVAARSPKPILQSVKLIVDPDAGSTLMATDLETGIRYRVLGIKADECGSVILPTAKLQSILRMSTDDELAIETDGDTLIIRGLHSQFKLPTENPDLFPDVPEFETANYHVVSSIDLRQLIRRTVFATDPESTRYALGGCLCELADESITFVGTDGRRLAKHVATAEIEGTIKPGDGQPVIPAKALKVIDRNLDDDGPVHIAINPKTSVMVRTERATIYSRLVEGRFPRYQDVFPSGSPTKIRMGVGELLSAVNQASIVTSEESRGIDFDFTSGMLKLKSQTADVGASDVDMPLEYHGEPIGATMDPRYLTDALKAMNPSVNLSLEIIDHKQGIVIRDESEYAYVIMPLTRDR